MASSFVQILSAVDLTKSSTATATNSSSNNSSSNSLIDNNTGNKNSNSKNNTNNNNNSTLHIKSEQQHQHQLTAGLGLNQFISQADHNTIASTASAIDKKKDNVNTMHLMGSITKKVVITPAFDIGVRRTNRTTTTNATAGKNRDFQNTEVGEEEEDEVVMMDM